MCYVLINKISVPNTITLQEPCLFKPSMIDLPIVVRVSPIVFLDTFARKRNEVDEIKIILTSKLKGMTFSHYMAEPKSTLCRKLVRIFY